MKGRTQVKKVLALFISVMMLFTVNVCAAPIYSDNVISLLSELSIMQGDPDGNMRFDDFVSRAEFSKIAVAASSYRNSVALSSHTSPFSDVPYTHWAAPYITVGVSNGLCRGYLDATFRPANTVLYEEAATMMLRVLGYNDSDFGGNWPDGQIGIAKNIGILDNINKSAGQEMTRRDVAALVYNTLNAKAKNSQSTYLSTFYRQIIDDVTLVATSNEDSNILSGKIFTSAGMYNFSQSLDLSHVGERGSIVLKNGDTVVSFIPNEEKTKKEKAVVHSVLDDGIITYTDGKFNQIKVNNDTVFYKNSTALPVNTALSGLEMGDVLYVNYKYDGTISHIMCADGYTIGPKTVKTSDWYTMFGADNSIAVMRDGNKATVSDVKINDVAYYLKELNMALVYSKKVTGIYESAAPNKDTPSSVTVSGVTYKIEGLDAFSKLSSNGTFNYGDTVTLLLGKNGDVADVATNAMLNEKVYGFLTQAGTKQTTVSGTTVTKPYVKVVLPSGEACEYITNKDYSSILNSAVSVTLANGTATVSVVRGNTGVSGTVTWTSASRKIGSDKLASTVEIIEVSTTESYENANTATVFPQRLNGITISSSSILYASKDSEGCIDALIIRDITGDMHKYGIITDADKTANDMTLSGTYEYISDGNISNIMVTNKVFNVSTGQPVKIVSNAKGITAMSPLTKINANGISDIAGSSVTLGSKEYILSDKVQIYVKKTYEYTMITMDEFIESAENYKVSAYIDKSNATGGRIRIIVLS